MAAADRQQFSVLIAGGLLVTSDQDRRPVSGALSRGPRPHGPAL